MVLYILLEYTKEEEKKNHSLSIFRVTQIKQEVLSLSLGKTTWTISPTFLMHTLLSMLFRFLKEKKNSSYFGH